MPPFDFTDLKPGDVLHYAGLGYGCAMVLTDVGPLRADHLGRPCRTVSLHPAGDPCRALHMTIHAGNAAAFARIPSPLAA
jgi:hypothetical protein